jgi:glutaredoxin
MSDHGDKGEKQEKKSAWTEEATEKLMAAFNRADEIGGELRDKIKEKMDTDPRYIQARKAMAKLLGRDYVSQDEQKAAAQKVAAQKAAVAAPTVAKAAHKGYGDPSVKAQIFGKKSCPWSGRAITLMEKHKVDFDWVDLEEPENEAKLAPLIVETNQQTVPFVYLRGKFVGGFNALSEIERLGQLDIAMMTPAEREAAPAHLRSVEIVARPNTDEVAPAEE